MSLVNQKDLLQKIMSKAIVKGGVGPLNSKLGKVNVSSPVGNTRVNLPGNVLMNDIAFFNQTNPFGDRATVRFKTDLEVDKENASPFPTYFQSVIVNEANTPIINQNQLSPLEYETVSEISREKRELIESPRVATTQIFPELTQNKNNFL